MARRARQPVVMLSALALMPALGLGALALTAQGKVPDVPTEASVPEVATELPAVMATPLLSMRRAPATLASDRRADVLAASSVGLVAAVDERSCLSLSLNDEPTVVHQSDMTVIPASNVKVIVAAVALEVLGPGASFTTTVVGPSPVNGVIDGDVFLVGGGDPVLSERWYAQAADWRKRPPLHVTDVNLLADAIAAAGVTRITGRVVGDASRYDDERFPPGWGDDVRASADGAPVGALVINDSFVSSGARDSDPTASAAKTFVALLADRGVQVASGTGSGVAPSGQAVLASVTSAPLVAIVNEMLATSDNLTAEMLLKEIAIASGQPPTRVAGLQVVALRLTEWGVPMAGVTLTDGSGLSRDNQLTCSALAEVLHRGTAGDAVGAGMARGGQPGSTLADSFLEPGLEGVLQGKTGSLREVKSLSGYFMAGTDEVSFVLILNGASVAEYQSRWDQLGAMLLSVAATPDAETLAPTAAPTGTS